MNYWSSEIKISHTFIQNSSYANVRISLVSQDLLPICPLKLVELRGVSEWGVEGGGGSAASAVLWWWRLLSDRRQQFSGLEFYWLCAGVSLSCYGAWEHRAALWGAGGTLGVRPRSAGGHGCLLHSFRQRRVSLGYDPFYVRIMTATFVSM